MDQREAAYYLAQAALEHEQRLRRYAAHRFGLTNLREEGSDPWTAVLDVVDVVARRAETRWQQHQAGVTNAKGEPVSPVRRARPTEWSGGLLWRQIEHSARDAARRRQRERDRRPLPLDHEPIDGTASPEDMVLERVEAASVALDTVEPSVAWLRLVRTRAALPAKTAVQRLGPAQRAALGHELGLLPAEALPNPPGSPPHRTALRRARHRVHEAVLAEVGPAPLLERMSPPDFDLAVLKFLTADQRPGTPAVIGTDDVMD